MEKVGDRVEYLRKQFGKTYNSLATELGNITADGIRKKIKNDRLDIYLIDSLCEKFGWDKDWILYGNNGRENDPPLSPISTEKYGSQISKENLEILDNMPLDHIISYLIYKNEELSKNTMYNLYVDDLTKQKVIEVLISRLNKK